MFLGLQPTMDGSEARGARREVCAQNLAFNSDPPSPFITHHSSFITTPAIRNPQSAIRNALTLVELLIVIGILTTLVAAAIPILSPSGADRRLKEASRGINTFITAAQSKAIANRRPFGVALKKLSQDTDNVSDNGVCLELYQVEQPPPFTGFDETSMVRISLDRGVPGQVRVQFITRGLTENDGLPSGFQLPVGWDQEQLPTGVIRPGDVIEIAGSRFIFTDTTTDLDAAGFYQSNSGEPDGVLFARVANDSGQMMDFAYDGEGFEIGIGSGRRDPFGPVLHRPVEHYWTSPMRYKILRQPMPTSAPPYQLPQGIAIDLRASGRGIDPTEPVPSGFFHRPEVDGTAPEGVAVDNADAVVIMFAPEGSIERLHLNNANQNPITMNNIEPNDILSGPVVSNVYLLVGRRENIPAADLNVDPTLVPANLNNATDPQLVEFYDPLNWLNTESRWVVIGSQSGRVVSTQNAFAPLRTWSDSSSGHPYSNGANNLQRRAWQIFAAREFAREMTQAGGG